MRTCFHVSSYPYNPTFGHQIAGVYIQIVNNMRCVEWIHTYKSCPHYAFIATHADIVNRSELINNLNLVDGTSKRECAKQRNNFTKNRIKEDFKAGLEEMVQLSGNNVKSRDFYLPVFTVSF